MFEITDSWGFALSKLAEEMSVQFSGKLSNYKIDSRDYGLLTIVYNNFSMTQKKIGTIMDVDRTTMVQIIDGLEEKDFIRREVNAKDRRQNIITITSLGKKVVEEMWQEMKCIEKKIIENAPNYQRQAVLEITELMEENNEKY